MRKWYPAFLIAALLIVSTVLYPRLPDTVPTSWTMRGQPDGVGPKWIGLFFTPMVMLGIWALLRLLPRFDPKRENHAKMEVAYDTIVNAILTTLAVVHVSGIAASLGAPLSLERFVPSMIGVMLVVVGNVLPQARRNWFFGIRTPWTLSSDRVWERTHRIGGYLMVSVGLIAIASAAVPSSIATPTLAIASVLAGITAVAYSYYAWRQEVPS